MRKNLPDKFCFLDLETTGTNPVYNRIIDIGILKVVNNKVVQKYETLVNPQTGIPEFIKNFTGISIDDLEKAPTFYEIKDEIASIFSDSILVAHNVRFDYGFLKNEFRRFGESFSVKHFCSIKLARYLFPNLDYYNLDSIIYRFGINCKRRHRAFDDAKVIFDFFNIAKSKVTYDKFQKAIDIAMKKPSLPLNIGVEVLDKMPEEPGVYMFLGADNYPIYIGKSINIADRVKSHFANDHLSVKDLQISQLVHDIKVIRTAGELGAMLLESSLIKKYQPLYNRMLRNSRKMIILKAFEAKDNFSTVRAKEVNKIDISDIDNIVGIFKSKRQLIDNLYGLAKQFNLCPKLLGLDNSKKSCFYYHLKLCFGACIKKEFYLKYNLRFNEAFHKYKIKRWIFDGPIFIKEKSDIEEGFIVDNWCLLGTVKNYEAYDIHQEYNFDLDTYKVLSKYIFDPPKNLSIQKLPKSKLEFRQYLL